MRHGGRRGLTCPIAIWNAPGGKNALTIAATPHGGWMRFLLCCSAPSRKRLDCSERMRRIGRRGRRSCGEGVRSNLKGLTLKRIDARSNVNDSAKAVVLCEYVIHVVGISVLLLAITPSVQYETKWVSERSVWMLRSDALLRYSFFYSGDNDYRNSIVSFRNTALLLIRDFFSTPLTKQKES